MLVTTAYVKISEDGQGGEDGVTPVGRQARDEKPALRFERGGRQDSPRQNAESLQENNSRAFMVLILTAGP